MSDNKGNRDAAFARLKDVLNTEPVRLVKGYLEARIECLRDLLEADESEKVRGQIRELRELIKILDVKIE